MKDVKYLFVINPSKDFNIKKFMDEFMEIGFMPISLLRWEMTGKNQTQIPPYWE